MAGRVMISLEGLSRCSRFCCCVFCVGILWGDSVLSSLEHIDVRSLEACVSAYLGIFGALVATKALTAVDRRVWRSISGALEAILEELGMSLKRIFESG